jgi:glycosyltransferase involved in cell wall biosynthesis
VILRIAAYILLVSVYGFTWLVAVLGGMIPRRRWKTTGRIMVTGTFFNPNWYLSHITPLVRSGVKEVILVIDEPQQPLDGVRFACPPKWLARLISRAGAKAIWMLIVGLRYRPDLYMGYHIFPSAVSALFVARLLNRPACYQDTSGPLELEGGGWHAENRVMAALGRPSPVVESLVARVVREFDLVVVRGTKAAAFIRKMGYQNDLVTITGSVETKERWREKSEREFDLAFVGRLTECKRPDRFISIVASVTERIPGVTAIVIGDGPDKEDLVRQSQMIGVEDKITFVGKREDVPELLSRSKVYVLTSRWEGLSIAMIEAMANGAVPVVSDVGDLRDLVCHGANGFVVAEDAIDTFSDIIVHLLSEEPMWRKCSLAAVKSATDYCSLRAVSNKWHDALSELLGSEPRCCDSRRETVASESQN